MNECVDRLHPPMGQVNVLFGSACVFACVDLSFFRRRFCVFVKAVSSSFFRLEGITGTGEGSCVESAGMRESRR